MVSYFFLKVLTISGKNLLITKSFQKHMPYHVNILMFVFRFSNFLRKCFCMPANSLHSAGADPPIFWLRSRVQCVVGKKLSDASFVFPLVFSRYPFRAQGRPWLSLLSHLWPLFQTNDINQGSICWWQKFFKNPCLTL